MDPGVNVDGSSDEAVTNSFLYVTTLRGNESPAGATVRAIGRKVDGSRYVVNVPLTTSPSTSKTSAATARPSYCACGSKCAAVAADSWVRTDARGCGPAHSRRYEIRG